MARKMRDSGVEWIGEVPEGWEIDKARRCFRQTNTRGNRSLVLLAATQKFGMYPQDRLEGVVKVKEDTDLQLFRTVHIDDFVISLRSFQGGFAHSKFEGVCSPAYQTFHAVRDIEPSYYSYLFKSDHFIQKINSLTVGIREGKNINYSDFSETLIPIPPLPEQRLIADYLDEKCAMIDGAIGELKSGIEDFKAWKKAIIFEAVTGKQRVGFNAEKQRGREAETPMRDSGIPWIGEIPEGWEVCKAFYALSMPITDGPHTTPELFDHGVPFVSAEAVSCGNGSIDFDHIRGYISEEFYQECCQKYIPQRNDIYMIKSGATTGRVAIVDTDERFTIWSPLAVFRVKTDKVIPKYFFYMLQSPVYQKQVELGWSFGTQQNIGMRALEQLKVLMPPPPEQQAIADYLDEKCVAIDALVAEKEKLIADLEAYKKSLIFELVTGKREVA